MRIQVRYLAREFRAIHLAGHDQVTEHQVIGRAGEPIQRLGGSVCNVGAITVVRQNLLRELGHFGPVLHNQDVLVALKRSSRGRLLDPELAVVRRKIQAYRRANAWVGMDACSTARLLNEAIHHRQSQP